MKKLLLVAVVAMVGAITGCGDAALPYLVSIQVSPATASVAAGLTQQFTAQGTFSNGATRDLTTLVTWSSSTLYVASIASSGLATTFSQGTSTITASFTQPSGTVTGTDTLAVGAPALVSVVVSNSSVIATDSHSLGSVKMAVGTSLQFFAYGIYTDGGERDITSSVTWSSNQVKVATFNSAGQPGRAFGMTPGTTTITATDPTTNISQSATLNVTSATVIGIVVWPTNQTFAPFTKLNFSAVGEFSDGSKQDVTLDVTWNSTNTAVATISNVTPVGVATGVAAGSTTIQAALGGATGATSLTVSSASLVSIALARSTSGLAIGSTLFVHAIGTFSDGTVQPINTAATWSVSPSDGSIATVNQGLVTGVGIGTATVKVQIGTVSTDATLTVENVSSIAVTPATATIAQETATPFDAVATLTDGTKQDITSSVTWVSTTPATATISDVYGSGGWANGIAAGTDRIGAVLSGQIALVQLTVSSATLSSIAIMPALPQNIALGTTQQYKAVGTFSDSTTQDLSYQVTWSSSDPPVAIINGTGLATATGVGSTMVKAAGKINGIVETDDKALTVF